MAKLKLTHLAYFSQDLSHHIHAPQWTYGRYKRSNGDGKTDNKGPFVVYDGERTETKLTDEDKGLPPNP